MYLPGMPPVLGSPVLSASPLASRARVTLALALALTLALTLNPNPNPNPNPNQVMIVLLREFASPDEEMKKIVLKVVKQCVATEGVQPPYVRAEILPEFFRNFWVRRMALDRRNYKQLVETTEELAKKVGSAEIITRVVEDLKDESEPYRKMVMETDLTLTLTLTLTLIPNP